MGGMEDTDAIVRAGVAGRLGDLRKHQAAGTLIAQLGRETDDVVRRAILIALEIMSTDAPRGRYYDAEITTDRIAAEDKKRFTDILSRMMREDLTDTLRLKTQEWLEVMAEDMTVEALNLQLKADLQGAEEMLLAARELILDSKNVNQKLGRFYYDNGEPEKGLEILSELGMVARARKLRRRPALDGVLEEPAWEDVAPLTEFYQCIWKMRAYPIEGKTEVYVGYVDNTLYVGIKGYEPTTENLAAVVTQRDGNVHEDDCVEVFLDTNRDSQTYYQFIVNTLGTTLDAYRGTPENDEEWNGTIDIATRVEETFWVAELGIPTDGLEDTRIRPGDIWGFNVARTRIANAAEYGQWVPTYGSALRPDRFGYLVFD